MTVAALGTGCRTVGRVVVLALALLGWLGTTSEPLHVHAATTEGFYNQAHVLSTLATVGWDAPASAPPQLGPLLQRSGAPVCAIETPRGAPGGLHADPRAPPSA
jgi:hypothetical protein